MEIPALRDKVIDSLEKLLDYNKKDSVYANTLNTLSFHYLCKEGEEEQGKQFAKEALQMSQELGYAWGMGQSYALLSDYERKKHHNRMSLEYNDKAIALIQKQKNNLELMGYIFFIRANALAALGAYPAALDYAMKSLNIRVSMDKESMEVAEVYNIQGRIHGATKKYNLSLECYQKALAICQKKKNLEQEAKLLNNIGDVYLKLDQLDRALEFQFKSLNLNEMLNSENGKATNYITIGEIYELKKDYKTALDYYEKGLVIDLSIGGLYEIAYDYNNFGYIYTALGEYELARQYYEKALPPAKEIDHKEEILRTYKGLSELYAKKRDYEQAYLYFKNYSELHDSVFGNENTAKISDLLNDAKIEQKQAEIELLNKDRIIKEEENKIYTIYTYSLLGGFILFAALAFILVYSNRQMRKINAMLSEQKKEIELQKDDILEKNKEITNSIRYAKHIQEAMLPFPERIQESFSEYFVLFKPRDIVSGDFYWFEEMESMPVYKEIFTERGLESLLMGFSNPKQVIAAVDCTGHGVPGAFMSMIGNDLLGNIIHEKGISEPNIILKELHKGIQYALKQRESHNDDGMDIAVCVIDKVAKKLEFAGAKSHLLYVQNNELIEIKGNTKSIGGFQKNSKPVFENHTICLEQPTTIYLFSDGYQDQFNGLTREKFKRSKLKNLIGDIHSLPLSEQKKILDDTFETWKGKQAQLDDVMIIGIKIDIEKEMGSKKKKKNVAV